MPNAKLGDLKLVNQNGDNIIDDKDRVYKGSSMPKFEMGLTFNADYKGFDFLLSYIIHIKYGIQRCKTVCIRRSKTR